jgi:hypothetical protein
VGAPVTLYPPGHPDYAPPGTLQTDLLVKVLLCYTIAKSPHGGYSSSMPGQLSPQFAWSTYRLARGADLPRHLNLRLFTCPRGQVGQGFDRGATTTETNMQVGCMFPVEVNVSHMSWTVQGTDRWDSLQRGTLKWECAQSSWGEVPLFYGSREDQPGGVLSCVGVSYPAPVCLPTATSFSIVLSFGA